MPIFELEQDGQTFEVDAPDADRAVAALGQMREPARKPDRTPGLATLGDFDRQSALRRYAGGVGEMLNPVTMAQGLWQAVRHPLETTEAIVEAQVGQAKKAKSMYDQGRYSEMVGHGVAAALPLVGPVAADVGEQIGEGDVAGGLGRGTGLLAPFLMKPAAQAVRRARGPRPVPRLTEAQEAVKFAKAQGIPMSAGQATGNPVVRGLEQINERTSLLASRAGERAREAQGEALQRVGTDLAGRAQVAAQGKTLTAQAWPVTPEQAGQRIADTVRDAVRAAGGAADDAYTRLRAIEAKNPAASAVDVRGAQQALAPLYERLLRESELVPLQGGKARALTAMDRLMKGPNTARLSDVDAALGDLKSLARADIPELRTAGQGAAAQAVRALDAEVQAAASRAGADALEALTAGRRATIAKYAAGDVLERIRTEPVQAFRQATAPKDAAVNYLRDIKRFAPEALPDVGRAYLEDLLTTATSEGGFDKAATIASKWRELGPETRSLLFTTDAAKDLDRFFSFAKRASESVNPSGSGFTASLTASGVYKVMNPVTGIPLELGQGALAKLLWSPKTVDLLTRGLRTPAKSSMGRRIAAQILAEAGPTGAVMAESSPSRRPSTSPAP